MTWHPVLDQLSPLPAEELGQIEIRASKALAFVTGPNEAPITVLSLVTEVRRLRERLERKEKLEAAALGTAKANWDAEQALRAVLKRQVQWLEHAARLGVGGADSALRSARDALGVVEDLPE